MIHSVFQDDDDDDEDLHGLVEPMDLPLPEDFKMEPFPPMSTSGFPEPTLVPGKEGKKNENLSRNIVLNFFFLF